MEFNHVHASVTARHSKLPSHNYPVSKDRTGGAGDPITYLSTPNAEAASVILAISPRGKTDWRTHPRPGYLYVLEGELIVNLKMGSVKFKTAHGFRQARARWHPGINKGRQRRPIPGGLLPTKEHTGSAYGRQLPPSSPGPAGQC